MTDIEFNQQGELFLSDEHTHRISVFDAQGRFQRCFGRWGQDDGFFDRPSGIAFAQNGDIYVVDTLNYRVQRLTQEGRFLFAWGSLGTAEGKFDMPWGIAVDGAGNVLVTDWRGDGDIYVCDWLNDRVQVFDPQGKYKDTLIGHSGVSKWARTFLNANPDIEAKLELATQNIEAKQRFYRPVSVKVDQQARVFVVDCYRHRVQIYQKVST